MNGPDVEERAGTKGHRSLKSLSLSRRRLRLYHLVAAGLAVWCAGYAYLVTAVIPNGIYWLSYYAADYRAGFVRRGLAGAIIDVFPRDDYFIVAKSLMVGSVAVFFGGLATLMFHILRRGNFAERRVVVALLIPVLPCAVSFALLGPRPELFAAGALLVFGVLLTRLTTARATLVCSGCYGVFLAILAFVHEAIPIEFALGSVLAIAVLARVDRGCTRWICTLMAVTPGLFASALIAVLGHHGVASELCMQLPHKMMENTFKVPPDKALDYLLGNFESTSDYHDWVCTFITGAFDDDVSTAVHGVLHVGFPLLAAQFAHGLLVCGGTLWLARWFTGVSWRHFIAHVRGGLAPVVLAWAMMLVIFATGVDWIRWWTIILINVIGIYLTFAADTSAIEQPIPKKQVTVFVAMVILLACIPLSGAAGYSTGFAK